MERFYRTGTKHIFGVTAWHGESGTVFNVVDCDAPDAEQPAVVASYRDKWKAENHAITGCPCRSQHHYYHGEKHEI